MSIYSQSDHAILKEIGARIRKTRLDKNLSQKDVSDIAGVSRMTVVGIEDGKNVKMISFIQILRALEQLDSIENFLPANQISPLSLAKSKGNERQRASKSQSNERTEQQW